MNSPDHVPLYIYIYVYIIVTLIYIVSSINIYCEFHGEDVDNRRKRDGYVHNDGNRKTDEMLYGNDTLLKKRRERLKKRYKIKSDMSIYETNTLSLLHSLSIPSSFHENSI